MKTHERALRVVMVVENNAYPDDVRVRSEAETLAQAGHNITVIAPRDPGQPWCETVGDVRVFRFPRPPSGRGVLGYASEFGYATLVATCLVMWRWLRDGLDVVHVHNPPDTLFLAGLLPKLARKPLIYDHHDLSPELYLAKYPAPNPWIHKVLLGLERWSCRCASWVIAVNGSYRQNDIQRNHIAPERIEVIRNGPDLRRIQPQAPAADPCARGSPVIGFVGRMARQDGAEHLLRALHELDRLGIRNWFCVMVGPAEDAAGLHALSDQLGLRQRIRFTGYLPPERWLPLLSAADICAAPEPSNPLNDKSTSIKIMEYMALGKPLVAYDLAEHRVSAGEAALYARCNDPQDFARQLVRLIESPELRATLGAIGQQRVREALAWEYSARRLVKLYKRVEQGPKRSVKAARSQP